MGYIEEPEGVDFYICSGPLTPEIEREITEYIRNYKLEEAAKEAAAASVAPVGSIVTNLSGAEPSEKQQSLTALSH